MNTPSFSDYAGNGMNFASGMPIEAIMLAIIVPIVIGVWFVSKS